MDEKDEEEVVVVTVVMRYDSSAYLRLTVTDVDTVACEISFPLQNFCLAQESGTFIAFITTVPDTGKRPE
jgi:hypothetical protein